MKFERIDIWDGLTYNGEGEDRVRPYMNAYVLDGEKKRGAVLVCPGGGYHITTPREGEPVALKFASAGYHTFVLHYSVAPRKHPQPLHDVSRAMCIIRQNKDNWNIDPDSIAVCGFSAGGHLAACLGVHWNKDFVYSQEGITPEMNKPNALILSYAEITRDKHGFLGSYETLLGKDYDDKLFDLICLDKHVGAHTPKTFLWHTFEDTVVPIENSMLFAQALKKNNIPFELHVYPYGKHGFSLATEDTSGNGFLPDPHIASWMDLCIEWLGIEFG